MDTTLARLLDIRDAQTKQIEALQRGEEPPRFPLDPVVLDLLAELAGRAVYINRLLEERAARPRRKRRGPR